MTLLEARGVCKAFGGIRALDTCSISVEKGTITGLIGPNGSGKTTMFNVVTGYERVDSGEIRFQEQNITNKTPDRVFGLGVGRTFQLTRIFPRMTVLENVHVAVQRNDLKGQLSRWSSKHEQGRALDLLTFVGLESLQNVPAGNLSFGQRKLLEFACVLIAEPQVILLDEPAGGINPTMVKYLADRILTLNQRGVTFLVVEHNMEFVMGLCQKVMVMHRGTMIAEGTPAEVRAHPEVLKAYLGD